jgi:hypothetical protein
MNPVLPLPGAEGYKGRLLYIQRLTNMFDPWTALRRSTFKLEWFDYHDWAKSTE